MITEDITKLSYVERYRRAFTALGRVLADPTRTDEVLEFTTYINSTSRKDRIEQFYGNPDFQRLYATHAAIDSRLDLDALAALPSDTLGYAYAHFLRDRGLTPDVFDGSPAGVTDVRTAYVMQRMRQSHDLWHVVTGYDTDAGSEVALQAFHLRAGRRARLAVPGRVRYARRRCARSRRSRSTRSPAIGCRQARRQAVRVRVGGSLGDAARRGAAPASASRRTDGTPKVSQGARAPKSSFGVLAALALQRSRPARYSLPRPISARKPSRSPARTTERSRSTAYNRPDSDSVP